MGKRGPKGRFTDTELNHMARRVAGGRESYASLARYLGMSRQHIHRLLKNRVQKILGRRNDAA